MQKRILAMAVASLFPTFSQAASSSEKSDETIVVTANRFEQKSNTVLASNSVITSEELDLIQPDSIYDVLKLLPGVEVNTLGGKSQDSSIYIRGSNPDHTLVLVDGVKVNSVTKGDASIGLIPVIAIQRVEVIRGPRAAAYGADAIGGVISITTTQGYEPEVKAMVGAGTQNHRVVALKSVGKVNEKTNGKFIYSNEKSDGYKIFDISSYDNFGYDSEFILGELATDFSDSITGRITAISHDSINNYSNSGGTLKYKGITTSEQVSGNLAYAKDGFASTLDVSTLSSQLATGYADDSNAKSIIDTNRDLFSWLNTLTISDITTLAAGLEYGKQYASRGGAYTTQFSRNTKYNSAGFITSSSEFDSLIVEASARYDTSNFYGSHNTWNLGLGYWIGDDWQIKGLVGKGYKEPSFNDLYYPSYGDENLLPETSLSQEVGLVGFFDSFDISLNFYKNKIDDLIVWNGTPSNVDQAEIKGTEFIANFSTGVVKHTVSIDVKNPKNITENSQLERRAKENASWVVTYSGESFHLSSSVNYTGKRMDDDEELEAYTLVNTTLGYFITPKLDVSLKIDNLFDKDYVTGLYGTGEFHGNERTYFLTAKYDF